MAKKRSVLSRQFSLKRNVLLPLSFLFYASGTIAASAPTAATNKALSVEHHAAAGVEISQRVQRQFNIVVQSIEPRALAEFVNAPCEVIPNANLAAIVAPRIQAQVVKRLTYVGDQVKKGQPVIILSSVAVAKAQTELLKAAEEWHRLKKLGKNFVSVKKYRLAQIQYKHAYAKLIAYGMTQQQVDQFLKAKNSSNAIGDFTLLAPKDGTILSAQFTEGEYVKAGQVLFNVNNESSLWANAQLSSSDRSKVEKGNLVQIKLAQSTLQGRVIQVHHQLNKITRTLTARVEINNRQDKLHPGQFVDCRIMTAKTKLLLSVPETAVLRSQHGDWTIYVENKPGFFQPVEVNVLKHLNGLAVIEGIKPGTRVVTKGAFFVHSELTKSGFATHNH